MRALVLVLFLMPVLLASAKESQVSLKKTAQNGHGIRRAQQRAAGFFPCLGARSRALCAIEDTGSTNRLGLRLTFDEHGEATVQPRRGEPQQVRLEQSQCKQFLHDLKAVGSLSALPVVHCVKSVSFGSSLFVELDGDRSPDLNCPSEDTRLEALKKQAYELLGAAREKAGIPSRPVLRLQPPVAPK